LGSKPATASNPIAAGKDMQLQAPSNARENGKEPSGFMNNTFNIHFI
jgi:hypothetical protein